MEKYKAVKNQIKKRWHWLALILLAFVFFIGASSFNYFTQSYSPAIEKGADFVKWASPDETANYILAKLYAQEGRLTIFEEYNLYVRDIMRPRSFRSDFGELKPVSFLGMPLIYGAIAFFTSYKIIPFLTPLFASLGIIYFYLLVKKMFGRNNALMSAFLLASFPPYIYYSARSMFHNVLFAVLLLIGLYYGFLMAEKSKLSKSSWLVFYFAWLYAGLAGFFTGLAIITRASELIWLFPTLFILWLFNVRQIGFNKLAIFLSFLFLALLPAFYHNQILYDSPYLGGYVEMNQSIINIKEAGADLIKTAFAKQDNTIVFSDLFWKIKESLFPFGLLPVQSWEMLKIYCVKMFYWLSFLSLFGFVLFAQRIKKWKKKHYAFLLSYFLASIVLIIYYGSWEFHDNPDPNSFTIGNSYTRYWLPVYFGALPFVSMFIMRLSRALFSADFFKNHENKKFWSFWAGKKFLTNSAKIIMTALACFISIQFVLTGSEEGLIVSAQKQKDSRLEWERVLKKTESNAAIITRYHDKLFFPERKVIVGLFDDKNMVAQYANLARRLPLYYYNFTLPPDSVKYLNASRLKEAGLQIKEVDRITNDFTLYKLRLEK